MAITTRRSAASPYAAKIAEIATAKGFDGMDPRHIEAFMRNAHPTFGHLSPDEFVAEVVTGCECVQSWGRGQAEMHAQCWGL